MKIQRQMFNKRRKSRRSMSKKTWAMFFVGVALILIVCFSKVEEFPFAAKAPKPNIIVILTDDQGYADVNCQGVLGDLNTPHIDALAAGGVRFTSAYVTAPQCNPSRCGLITGRYQQRYAFNENINGALPWSAKTIAERLEEAGYATGMVGKWGLQGIHAANGELPAGGQEAQAALESWAEGLHSIHLESKNPGHVGHHGFHEFYMGSHEKKYLATHAANGAALSSAVLKRDPSARRSPMSHHDARFRVSSKTEWAVNFIKRHSKSDEPFFLFVSYFAPHAPLAAPPEFSLSESGETSQTRQIALAMMSAIDDGVGQMTETLRQLEIEDETLVFFLSDNGAPVMDFGRDAKSERHSYWNGSFNDPYVGGKGMLTEGGLRVPFVAAWKNVIPPGQVYDRPVSALDIAATAVAVAGLRHDPELDGTPISSPISRARPTAIHTMRCTGVSGSRRPFVWMTGNC